MKIIEGTAHQEVMIPVRRRLHESAKRIAAQRGFSVTELYRRLLQTALHREVQSPQHGDQE